MARDRKMKAYERLRVYNCKYCKSYRENGYIERSYKEYDGEFDLVNEGAEDFTKEREAFEEMRYYSIHTWYGKRDKGNHKWWKEEGWVAIRKKDLKNFKEYVKARYPEALETQVRAR